MIHSKNIAIKELSIERKVLWAKDPARKAAQSAKGAEINPCRVGYWHHKLSRSVSHTHTSTLTQAGTDGHRAPSRSSSSSACHPMATTRRSNSVRDDKCNHQENSNNFEKTSFKSGQWGGLFSGVVGLDSVFRGCGMVTDTPLNSLPHFWGQLWGLSRCGVVQRGGDTSDPS